MTSPIPLHTAPVLLEKVWGGRRLSLFGKPLPDGALVGESWELADLASTSAGGAGGGAFHSVVAGGPCAGRTVRDALAAFGDHPADRPLPLLCKLLDAGEHLSVQVHPSPAYAAAHPEARLKSECWYVLAAEPGAELFIGLADGVSVGDLPELASEGRAADAMVRVPARVGDCHSLPSGIVHALGAGVVVAEVQTPSDTTFRLYDWTREYRRPERALHIEESRAAAVPELRPETLRLGDDERRGLLARFPEFTLEGVRLHAGTETVRLADGWCVVMVADGDAVIGGSPARRGDTLVLPSALAERVEMNSARGATLLVASPGR